ncbi:MAG: prepilin-type N-terminal cleavage/methylation domain-containing protein [Eubacteriaceae bacterium]|nr:prepilin-type N-terminal cleavage/methylation domain-containing protein [Eubacteriaceae bacterium]
MKKRQFRQAGFTLVEIIVVLVVLAILAAFTIPAMLGFVEDARSKATIAQAREVYTAGQSAAGEMYGVYDGGTLTEEAYSDYKQTFAQKIVDLVGSDLGITKAVGGNNPQASDNSLEVGTKFTLFYSDANKIAQNRNKFYHASAAKVWIDSTLEGAVTTSLDFHVKAVWFVDGSKKYLVEILEDPTFGGPKTTVYKRSGDTWQAM